ncbi:MAG: AMP-binding protein, partial [Muribaculaceae bacterium]|nr:AMP-binding protein [Muribaculaceae bacterium]
MTFEDFKEEWNNDSGVISARTSGSTGNPKLIELDKAFVKESAVRTINFFGLNSSSRLHSCVGADFIGGKMMAGRSFVTDCHFTWETPSNRPLERMSGNDKLTLIALVPSQMIHILENLDRMPEIDYFLIGGSSIPRKLREAISEAGLQAWESYGMTETASHIALRKIEKDEGWFEALPGITLASDERGCLVIKFENGIKVTTNDNVIFKDSRHFRITGRADNVIITGGKKVNPEEIENKLEDLFHGDILLTGRDDDK